MICIRKSITCRAKLPLLGVLMLCVAQPAWSLCSATPQAALADYQAGGSDAAKTDSVEDGFRVWKTQRDPALGREWFWITACSASSKPAQLLWTPLGQKRQQQVVSAAPVPAAVAQIAAVSPLPAAPARKAVEDHRLIHVGDTVIVMQSSDAFSMRLQGQALQGGELGAKVQVQVNAWNKTTVLSGEVSAKGEVRIGS
jgi:Chaperone for flagella basal body P-ring formation